MRYVTGWYMEEKIAMKFAIPRIWRQPTDHSSNWYFCMADRIPNVALARMRLKSFIQTFLLPLPQYHIAHTAPSCLFPLPRRGISHLQETAASQTARKILEIQITFSQMR